MDTELRDIREQLAILVARIDTMLQPGVELIHEQLTMAIVRVLEREGRPLRPVQIARILRDAGRDDPDHIVQVTTNGLFHRGRISRVAESLYQATSLG